MLGVQAVLQSSTFWREVIKVPVPRFWREIPNRYNLIGSKCGNCDEVFFPPRHVCPKCRRIGKLQPYQLDGKGKVISHTIVHAPPEDFADESPYVLAIIELEEGPRVTGQITDCDPDEVEIGDDVEAKFRYISEESEEGLIYYGYKFKKV
ncbi:MAG: Zn-ribbon domain-containing OB-fold protein [Hadesarchaea archaeon]|nr:Zn-ribbon domain-containing OB-fold protein [Hadesarchaea archaeon]